MIIFQKVNTLNIRQKGTDDTRLKKKEYLVILYTHTLVRVRQGT